ncbi:glutathione peroxidase [Candidatus Latescibacterota bacterium]
MLLELMAFGILGMSLPAVMCALAQSDFRSVLDFTMKSIDDTNVPLDTFKGKVLLIVNVASKCGLIPQYAELQELYETYGDKGFVILGFPANNFKGQEPGANQEIKTFCSLNYNVTFPMFSKISVRGKDRHDLYTFLTGKETNPDFSGAIKWNFTKFLVDRNGQVIGRFEPKTTPLSPEVVQVIEQAL